NKAIVGKSIIELNMMETYRATIIRVRRAGVDITPHPSTRLRYGDKVLVSSSQGNVKGVSDLLGDSMKQLTSTSFLPISLGIILGVVVGMLAIPMGSMDFSLGLTGGVLLTSLLLSYKGKTGPIIWAIPSLSNSLLRQLGLLMFLTPVGLRAGSNIISVFQTYGIELFIIGALITIIPMVIATAIGYYVMKINFFTLMGAITGGMTSTPGLSSAESLTESGAPQVAYATVYPFALVVIIIMSQILVALPGIL
ncbi:MAG: transporter, partial [Flavobacteriales bacterium]|nr:transporter [Flavobacteriales bacterium]